MLLAMLAGPQSRPGGHALGQAPVAGRSAVWLLGGDSAQAGAAEDVLAPLHDLKVFPDGASAIEQLTAGGAPDLLLVEGEPPDMTSAELCQRVRASRGRWELPVLVLAAPGAKGEIARILRAGANDCVAAPVDPAELCARVDCLLEVSLARTAQAAQSARSLEEAATRLNAILDSAVDGILTIDERGVIEHVNTAASRIFGYSREEMLGRNVSMLMPEPYQSHHDGYLAAYRRTGVRKIIGIGREVRGLRKDGTEFPVDLSISESSLGGRRLFTGIIRDITERKRHERERELLLESERAARSEAERASLMKDEFLAMLSHELRTPLNAILGWTQLLRRPNATRAQLDRGLEVIERNARMQAQLVSDLLDISRIIAGKLRVDLQPVDLAVTAEAAIDSFKAAAAAKGVELRASIEPLEQPVEGDPNRLQQVIANLISNAVKFTPAGGHVEVSLASRGGWAELRVRDTGEGIAPDFLPHLFDRFRQADSSMARHHGGLGLGLSLVKHLVERHGGRVRAESRGIGQGATFTVELPCDMEPQTREVLGQARARAPGPHDRASLAGVTVLVVDDEPDARELTKRLLEEHDATVVTASSGPEALAVVRASPPDLLVSDIGMPGMDGYALIREIRAARELRVSRVPAVAVTAFARPEDRDRALAAGFQAHIAKPFEPADFVIIVATVAALGAAPDSSREPVDG